MFGKTLSRFLPLILFLILTIIFCIHFINPERQVAHTNLQNQPLPYFVLSTINHSVLSSSNMKGKVRLLHVWATWCATCRDEHNMLMQLALQHIPIDAIAYKDNSADVAAWLKQYDNPYEQVGLDTEGTTAIDLGVTGTPETFVIDSQGLVRMRYIGAITNDAWVKNFAAFFKTSS